MPTPKPQQYDFSAFGNSGGGYDFSAFGKPKTTPPPQDSIGFTDVLKAGAQGIGDVLGGLVSGFGPASDSIASVNPTAAAALAAKYQDASPTRRKLATIPVVGPQIADIAAPGMAYASGRAPTKQENLDAVRSGTATATALAAPIVAPRVAATVQARAATPPPPSPSLPPMDEAATVAPTSSAFYGEEAARGPFDPTPPRPAAPPPSTLQQVAQAVKTGAGVIRHPIRSGVTAAADVLARRLAPDVPATRPLPPPSTPEAVAALQLTDTLPAESPLPSSMAGVPPPSAATAAQAALMRQRAQIIGPQLDESAIPPSQMQPTSEITPTGQPSSIPTSSRQIALSNALEDYTSPTEPQIPAPRNIRRKTAQLEIGGETVGTRVPYESQLPEPTPTIEAARLRAEHQLERRIAATSIARDTMQSKSFPSWSAEDQQAFGTALRTSDPGAAAAASNIADQRASGIADPTFGAITHLPDTGLADVYNGDVQALYVDPHGTVTPLTDLPAYQGRGIFRTPEGGITQSAPAAPDEIPSRVQQMVSDPNGPMILGQIAQSPFASKLYAHIAPDSKIIGSGYEALVLDNPRTPSLVTRIGRVIGGAERPNVPEVLQPVSSQRYGHWAVEQLPKVTMGDVTAEEAAQLQQQLQARGLDLYDIGSAEAIASNLGRTPDGRVVVVDGGAVIKPGDEHSQRYRYDQAASQPDAAEFALQDIKTGRLDHQNGRLVATTPMDQLLPSTFKIAGQVLASSQRTSPYDKRSGEYGLSATRLREIAQDATSAFSHAGAAVDLNGTPRVLPPDYSNYSTKVLEDGQRLPNTVTTFHTGTGNSDVNDPFIILHEYGHAAYERDLTKQQKTRWALVIQHYQRKLDQASKSGTDYETVTGVPEAIKFYAGEPWHSFPSLFASYVLDPIALKQKYPDIYYFIKDVAGGREYLNTATTQTGKGVR